MFLADIDIKQAIEQEIITIIPYDRKYIRPASICLRLGYNILEFTPNTNDFQVDLKNQKTYPLQRKATIGKEKGFALAPHDFILACTFERISISRSIAGWISGLSGLARLGLQIALSNLVSPGYGESSPSTLTLEITNFSNYPITLYPEMRICHLAFIIMSNPSETGYDSLVGTYSNQDFPRESIYFTEFKK